MQIRPQVVLAHSSGKNLDGNPAPGAQDGAPEAWDRGQRPGTEARGRPGGADPGNTLCTNFFSICFVGIRLRNPYGWILRAKSFVFLTQNAIPQGAGIPDPREGRIQLESDINVESCIQLERRIQLESRIQLGSPLGGSLGPDPSEKMNKKCKRFKF